MEMKQQKPQEEEIPIWVVMAGRDGSKALQQAPPSATSTYDLPTWGQIKPLLIKIKKSGFST